MSNHEVSEDKRREGGEVSLKLCSDTYGMQGPGRNLFMVMSIQDVGEHDISLSECEKGVLSEPIGNKYYHLTKYI